MVCLSMKIIIISLILVCGPLFRSGGLSLDKKQTGVVWPAGPHPHQVSIFNPKFSVDCGDWYSCLCINSSQMA